MNDLVKASDFIKEYDIRYVYIVSDAFKNGIMYMGDANYTIYDMIDDGLIGDYNNLHGCIDRCGSWIWNKSEPHFIDGDAVIELRIVVKS